MEDISELFAGGLATALGLVGLILASGALDAEMYLFGLSLAGFAVFFDMMLVKRHFDRQDAAAPAGAHAVAHAVAPKVAGHE